MGIWNGTRFLREYFLPRSDTNDGKIGSRQQSEGTKFKMHFQTTLSFLLFFFFLGKLSFSRAREEGGARTAVLKHCKFFCLLTEICKQGV